MLTPDLILEQATTLTATNKFLLLVLLRKSPIYQMEIINGSGDTASAKIDAASTIQIQSLNGLLKLVNDVGSVKIAIQRDPDDALVYDTQANLVEIANEIFYILYAEDPTLAGPGIQPGNGIYGSYAAVGQRCLDKVLCSCSCNPCKCSSKPSNWIEKAACSKSC